MKARGRARAARQQAGPRARGDDSFMRGAIAAGCIAAFQDLAGERRRSTGRRVLRHALQGGVALSAGSSAVRALEQRNVAGAVLACAAGAAGVYLIDVVLREPPAQPAPPSGQENELG